MVYLLFNFYKKELSTKQMIFSDMKGVYYSLIISSLIWPILAFFIYVFCDRKLDIANSLMLFLSFLFSLIPLGVSMFTFNQSAKKKTMKLYGLQSDNFLWNSNQINNKIRDESKKKLLEYIKNNKKDANLAYIKRQSKLAQKNAEKIKFKYPVGIATFVALFIPFWSNFTSWLSDNSSSLNDVSIYFMIIFLLIIFMSIILESLNDLLVNEIFNRDYNKMNKLSELLDELCFDMQNNTKYLN